ncbi:MAG: hypothetical protein M0D53_12500 [Flavobacterium sp. JAD_PAG50586_2]|nr:MAG: hypothetical protein M0D53_12500 [Flavobacterium sp. JAD_PAG50586_2]
MTFPLQIESVETIDSKDNIQIQLADILASSFALYGKNILLKFNETDKMSTIIAETKLAKMNVHPLQPDLSFFEKSFKSTSDDVNPLDYLAKKTMDVKDKFDQSYPK